jgi:hypothetical protein
MGRHQSATPATTDGTLNLDEAAALKRAGETQIWIVVSAQDADELRAGRVPDALRARLQRSHDVDQRIGL